MQYKDNHLCNLGSSVRGGRKMSSHSVDKNQGEDGVGDREENTTHQQNSDDEEWDGGNC